VLHFPSPKHVITRRRGSKERQLRNEESKMKTTIRTMTIYLDTSYHGEQNALNFEKNIFLRMGLPFPHNYALPSVLLAYPVWQSAAIRRPG
jgi:hypothetical protein